MHIAYYGEKCVAEPAVMNTQQPRQQVQQQQQQKREQTPSKPKQISVAAELLFAV